MKVKFDAIIVTSDEPYGKMWHTQLIFTDYLAKQNKVWFIEPPKKWNLKNVFKWGIRTKIIFDNLKVIQYPNIFPSKLNKFNEWFLVNKLTDELESIKAESVLIWSFDSFRSVFSSTPFNIKFCPKRIYHIIDPFYNNPKDEWLSEHCNIMIITSPRNNEFYKQYSNKIINIPQCFNLELEQQFVNGSLKISSRFTEAYFVLIGTISDAIDFDWLMYTFKQKNKRLVIAGNNESINFERAKWNELISFVNVEYLGMLDPAEFYPILKRACGGLIVYNEINRKGIRSPLKALNYLVSSLPIFTNTECEMPDLLNHCIYYCTSKEMFNENLNKRINRDIEFDAVRAEKYLKEVSIKTSLTNIMAKL